MTIEHWLLPDGVEDILPETAIKIEQGRRILLDVFRSWGYEYIIPPKLEYLESLLTGTGRDLDLKTFKVVEDGYEFFAKRSLVTLFSAPNYCGEFDNAAAMMTIDE